MTSPRRIFLCLSGTVVLVATLAIYRQIHFQSSSAKPERAVASASISRLNAEAAPAASDSLGQPSRTSPSSPVTQIVRMSRPDPVLPTAVQNLLPSVSTPVANWKEFKPEKITIAPYPDMPIEFEATSITEEHGRTVWTGRSAIEGAFLVSAATENDWHATLVIPPAGAFEIHIAGETVTMLEKNHQDEMCGSGATTLAPRPGAAGDVLLSNAAPSSPQDANVTNSGDSLTTVDVLFFYDPATLAQIQNNAATFETRMIGYVASSNAALQNSAVTNYRWRYLASYPVPAYTTTSEDLSEDLFTITGYSNVTKAYSTNPVLEFIFQKSILHGADQVVLYVTGNRTFSGRAWIYSASVTFHSSVVVWNTSYMTLAHELSHNFGCNHDRETDSAPDSNGRYDYGFRYSKSGQDTGTIMSYASSRVPYFSNPLVSFEGVVLGVPEGQPKAANNSRVLRETAPAMIATRAAIDPPVITGQPQSVTLTVGENFTLSVTATGPSLTYQWKNGASNITGATNTSFSKSNAVAGDSGSYTVTITNIAGQVTSSGATVTVNAAAPVTPTPPPVTPTTTPPVTPAPAAAGGGGGGGGAIDPWFALGGGAFFLLRCVRRKRIA